jgi:hypothetical protein
VFVADARLDRTAPRDDGIGVLATRPVPARKQPPNKQLQALVKDYLANAERLGLPPDAPVALIDGRVTVKERARPNIVDIIRARRGKTTHVFEGVSEIVATAPLLKTGVPGQPGPWVRIPPPPL